MPDREKVIDGIERLRFFNQRAGRELWGDKPTEIQNNDIADADNIFSDALALLKEQEAVEPKLYTPTTPTFWKSWYTCGVCEWPVREKTEWGSGDKFCPKCGRRIKWPKKEEDENV